MAPEPIYTRAIVPAAARKAGGTEVQTTGSAWGPQTELTIRKQDNIADKPLKSWRALLDSNQRPTA
jgi:hypothetical protein